ncbi:DUF2252 family protein [Sphingomonas sp. OK281]|uniref:DUF2252 family protein n=1 Tax=Sphingomonas sp. OK281 TaxID=1881067 RepID=UPI0008E9CA9E|nr:DUF2252 family protein [Sphingomonas sp. OK281]SFO10318.1 Uncharacterized conserved protein, DUF2252 family [Sphingomonas sp. OK281]
MAVNPAERSVVLARTRALKMSRSVHAYVRGNTAQFYEWLEASPVAASIPDGPAVWICGDCHLGNLGPVADADHRVDIQIRDLDQTVIANPAYDLIRLGLSLETAARSSDLPGVTTAQMIEAMIDGYSRALTPTVDDDPREPNVVRAVRREAIGRRWRHLAKDRLEDVEPTIPHNKRFWKLAAQEKDAIVALFAEEQVRARSLALAGLANDGSLRVVDAAYWRKGCSSLGRLRFAVLICVSDGRPKNERLALVDIKEAVSPVVPIRNKPAMPQDPAERVVAGAKALSPNLGERMIAASLLDKPVVLRELAPQDLKIEVDQFSRKEAIAAASYLSFVVGQAHARQLTNSARLSWRDMLTDRDDKLDAPSWLWQSIVTMAGAHEVGYLEHCRRFALSR